MNIPTELIIEYILFLDNIKDIDSYCKTNKRLFDICKNNSNIISTSIIEKIITKKISNNKYKVKIPLEFKKKVTNMVNELRNNNGDFETPNIETRHNIHENNLELGILVNYEETGLEETELNKLYTYLWKKNLIELQKEFYEFTILPSNLGGGYSFQFVLNNDNYNDKEFKTKYLYIFKKRFEKLGYNVIIDDIETEFGNFLHSIVIEK